ncbi:MAG: CPBP family intramembrane glutamic endopeptidase [Chloroflexia bacterium]
MSATLSISIAREGRRLSIRDRVASHPLVAFFLLAYGGAWLALLPLMLAQNGLGVLPFHLPAFPFLVLASFAGPALSAVVITRASEGNQGVRDLFRRYRPRRASYLWYLLALYGPLLAIVAITSLQLGGTPLAAIAGQPLVFFSAYSALMLTSLPSGPLGEELGWRGFALPRLQKAIGPFWGSLVLGVLWAGWHAPLFFLPDWKGSVSPLLIAVAFSSWVIPFTFIMTWVYNSAQGSTLAATLMHAGENAAVALMAQQMLLVPGDFFLQAKVYGVLAIALIIATRGRLAVEKFRELPPVTFDQASAGERKRLTPRMIAIGVAAAAILAYVAVNLAYDAIHGMH